MSLCIFCYVHMVGMRISNFVEMDCQRSSPSGTVSASSEGCATAFILLMSSSKRRDCSRAFQTVSHSELLGLVWTHCFLSCLHLHLQSIFLRRKTRNMVRRLLLRGLELLFKGNVLLLEVLAVLHNPFICLMKETTERR